MVKGESGSYVDDLYAVFFGRVPHSEERDHWIEILDGGMPEREIFARFKSSREYKSHSRIKPTFPAGHYYSPIVDPEEVRKYRKVDWKIDPVNLRGIHISVSEMLKVWEALRGSIAPSGFRQDRNERYRYFWDNKIFPIGDAAILRAMILNMEPRKIIEIGSGFSSACMLDALDEAGPHNTMLTFIEPHPNRLRSLLKKSDESSCKIIDEPVQAVDPELFVSLQDIQCT